jgi:leader peptidase (prepilin peptidase)/N-methyltransferase
VIFNSAIPVVAWVALGIGSIVTYSTFRVPRWRIGAEIVFAGVLATILVFRFPHRADQLIISAFVLGAIPLALEDALTSRLPNRMMGVLYGLTGTTMLLVCLAFPGPCPLGRAVAGMLLCCLFFGGLYLLAPGGLGGGDVKLAGPLGATLAWVDWRTLIVGILLGWLTAAIGYGVTRLAGSRRQELPLGPFLIGATILILFITAS